MKEVSIPFIQLKECFPNSVDLNALKKANIDEAVQLLERFILLSWKEFFKKEPEIKDKDKKIEKDKNCISYTIKLNFKENLHEDCFEMLEQCKKFANIVEFILKAFFEQRIIANILCDSCEKFDKQTGKRIITTALSERYTITDFVSISATKNNGSQEITIPLEYIPRVINLFIENMESIAKKFEVNLEELKSAIIELLITYSAMKENCNMCTSYRFYEVLKVILDKLKLERNDLKPDDKWNDLEPYFDKSIVPEFLRKKELKNIIKEITKRMNKPLSELSIEERHAKVKTTDSRKNEKIPSLTSKQICQIMEKLLEAFLKKILESLIERPPCNKD